MEHLENGKVDWLASSKRLIYAGSSSHAQRTRQTQEEDNHKGVSMSTRSTPVFHKLRLLLQQRVEEHLPWGSMVISVRCVRKSL